MSSSSTDARVYVGNLPPDVREKDVEDLFWKYGDIKNVTLINRRGPPFAFVEFIDYRDADDAVKGRSGYNFDGYKLRVEHPKSNNTTEMRSQYQSSYSKGGPASRRTRYRVVVKGLPATGSWQDLKDHMREAGDVCYADVYRDGSGIVEYIRRNDMIFAVRHLDNTKFKSHEGETAYIRVELDDDGSPYKDFSSGSKRRQSPSYSSRHSSSPSRSRSRSTSPYRSKRHSSDSLS